MEPKFINQCEHTLTFTREMMFASLGKVRIAIYVIGILFCGITSGLLFAAGSVQAGISLALCTALLFVVIFVRPLLAAKQTVERNKLLSDKPVVSVLEFYDDHLMIKTDDRDKRFDYANIKKLKTTKHLYLLALPQRLYFLVDRNGFTKGQSEDFPVFMKEKLKK